MTINQKGRKTTHRLTEAGEPANPIKLRFQERQHAIGRARVKSSGATGSYSWGIKTLRREAVYQRQAREPIQKSEESGLVLLLPFFLFVVLFHLFFMLHHLFPTANQSR